MTKDKFADKRQEMLQAIRRHGVRSQLVLDAMGQVPRHKFVDKKYWEVAYEDAPVQIGHGQTMSQPYTVAFMTQLLSQRLRTRSDLVRILEIGTGSGYQAAVLSKLCDEVYSVEVIPGLSKVAKSNLKIAKINNVFVKIGDGHNGWTEHAPYDAIMVTAGVSEEKQLDKLFMQLKAGGVLVAPVGKRIDKQMTRFTKTSKANYRREKFDIFHFVPFVKK